MAKKIKKRKKRKVVPLKDRIIIGLTERITVIGEKKQKIIARIDTGATKSSIDSNLAVRLKVGPVVGTKMVKSAHGVKIRPMVRVKVDLKGKVTSAKFTLADRKHMKYRVLIGQNILKRGFLIDPNKK